MSQPSLQQEMHDAIRAALKATGGPLPDRAVTAMANTVAQVAEQRQVDVAGAVGRLLEDAPPEDPGLEALARAHQAVGRTAIPGRAPAPGARGHQGGDRQSCPTSAPG